MPRLQLIDLTTPKYKVAYGVNSDPSQDSNWKSTMWLSINLAPNSKYLQNTYEISTKYLKKYLRKLLNMMQKLNYLITLNLLDIRF